MGGLDEIVFVNLSTVGDDQECDANCKARTFLILDCVVDRGGETFEVLPRSRVEFFAEREKCFLKEESLTHVVADVKSEEFREITWNHESPIG